MYTPADIQSAVRRIHEEASDLKSRENRFRGELGSISGWWEGKACKSFIDGYTEIGVDMNRVFSEVSELESGLRKLASEVQRADEERRRIEAERKRAAEQAKSKKA